VPLGELGVDVNRPVGISRKQQEASKDYVRVVKKLKVAHGAGQEQGEDKENASSAFAADMKVLNEDGNLKRATVKNEGFHAFVGMRMEDDEIEGSPKKKLRQPTIEQHTHAGDRGGDKEEIVEMGSEKATEALSRSDEGGYGSEDPLDETETGEAQEPREEPEQSDLVEPVDKALEDQRQITTLPVGVDMAAQGRHADDAEVSSDELRSSSPPTILAENVMVDELEARESSTPTKTKTTTESQSHESPESWKPAQDSTTQIASPRRISDDDTAFLRAFMSRTKASKAEQAAQDQILHSTALDGDGTNGVDAEQERSAIKNSDHLIPAVRFEPSDQEDQEEDAVPTSPLRRSKRAVVTSIPRPQILPNAIQLKRANGNEFIFKANQASSTANVAMATRSNTKKNKGTAINVPARLEEILAEKAKEHNAEHEASADASKAIHETSNDKATKKRKRDKYDTGSKAKKVLRWNDENLVSYQEAEQNLDSDDIEDSAQESAREKDKENYEPNKHVKLALTLGHASSETISTEEDKTTEQAKETAQPKKDEQRVRRVRRGIVGSVNGTPAPKTRSKSVIENDEIDGIAAEEGALATVSDAVAASVGGLAPEAPLKSTSRTAPVAAAAGTTRKSRMPVPLTARRGAPASASVKHGGSSLPARATASVSRGTKRSKEGGNGMSAAEQEGEKEGAKADLLGKRRLRVRS